VPFGRTNLIEKQHDAVYRGVVARLGYLVTVLGALLALGATSVAAATHSVPSDRFYACRGGQFHVSFADNKLTISSGSRQIASIQPTRASVSCTRTTGPAGHTSGTRTATSKSTKLLCSTTQGHGRYVVEVYRSAKTGTTVNVGWVVAERGSTTLFLILQATLQLHKSSLSYWSACGRSG
jgi:hypothetical protein